MMLVDKPTGPTSHDVVARVRRVSGVRRVGHAGTLDPFASGLLLVLLGPATRLAEYLLGLDKAYLAVARLGVETATDDPEGEIVEERSGWEELREEDVREALRGFRGTILQRPPVYSAKKVRGEAAHRRTRRGERVDLEPVWVVVSALDLMEFRPPRLAFSVRCSSGTYVRALARDLGRVLGVGAHLTELRRTAVGPHEVGSAVSLEDLGGAVSVSDALVPPALVLPHLPVLEVGAREASLLRQGRFLPRDGRNLPEGEPLRVLLGEALVGVGCRHGEEIRPRKVLVHD
jgi:tRNA pseudouridine55 synthase